MSKTLLFEMVTPEKLAYSGQARFVALPAFAGEMGILPGHAPFLVQLKCGEVRVHEPENIKRFAISGGFAEISRDQVSLFAETAEMADSIDAERARQALDRAQAELQNKQGDSLTLAQAEAAMRRAQVRLKLVRRHKGSSSR